MTVSLIPLTAVPIQTMTVQLGAQACRFVIRQRRTGLFVDLYIQDTAIFLGVKALDRNKLVREDYLDFAGELFFVDTQGTNDPDYMGLADRYQFLWDDAA